MADVEMATSESYALRRSDRRLLLGFCLLLFGYSMVGGRPLTMHEAIVPQTAREMQAAGDWIVPKVGGQPWLERPPLPQWVTIAICGPLGGCDREWVVRLPANLMGVAVVLVVAGLSARWFGRSLGLIAGFVLATMFGFVSYAWLAEPDIYLCLLVTGAIATFAHLETTGRTRHRPWPLAGFFLLLGATNLAKGLLFGTAMVLIPIGGYLTWNLISSRDWTAIRRYVWAWGWIVFAVVGLAWPLAVYQRHPDVLEFWRSFLFGRLDGSAGFTEPYWYYLTTLPWQAAPWTLFSVAGLIVCVRSLRREPSEPLRFLVCWAVLPLLVLSLASNKHHHYLLQNLAPWAMLGAIGLQWCWHRLSLRAQQHERWVMSAVLATIVAIYALWHSVLLPQRDQVLEDTAFLHKVSSVRDSELPLVVNADPDLFRNLFYLDSSTVTISNLSQLDDERFVVPELMVIARARDHAQLESFGEATLLLQSVRSRRETGPGDRLSLFQLRYRPDLARRRYPAPTTLGR